MVAGEIFVKEVASSAVKEISSASFKELSKTGLEGNDGKEYNLSEFDETAKSGESFEPNVEAIKNSSIDAIEEENKSDFINENFNEGLSDADKVRIKEETGWAKEIVDAIQSKEEAEIYKNAGLVETEINEKKCLIRNDIDWDQKDSMGRTNKERAEQGLSPINKDGKVIELHHIGQHADSPLAELTTEEHRGKGNDAILHDKTKETEIDRNVFSSERIAHWEARTKEGDDQA